VDRSYLAIARSCTVKVHIGRQRAGRVRQPGSKTHKEKVRMSQGNYIVMTGYVTAEPKLARTTKTPMAKIRVGSTPRWLNRTTGEWQDGETSYYNVTCWRRLAVNVSACLRKGDMIVVRGKFRTRTWVDEQQHTRVELNIEAESVGHDMSYGWSHFNRGVFVPPGTKQGIAAGEAARQDMAPDDDLPEDPDFAYGPDGSGGYGSVPGDEGFDGGPGTALAADGSDGSDGSDGPRTPESAPYQTDQPEPAQDSILAELAGDLGQQAVEPQPAF
jgi:single-strand DNA-binding protein